MTNKAECPSEGIMTKENLIEWLTKLARAPTVAPANVYVDAIRKAIAELSKPSEWALQGAEPVGFAHELAVSYMMEGYAESCTVWRKPHDEFTIPLYTSLPAPELPREAMPTLLPELMAALHRFHETIEDDASYDISKEHRDALIEFGAVRMKSHSWCNITTFGEWLIKTAPLSESKGCAGKVPNV